MARILTIFGPNESRQRELFFEIFSKERKTKRTNEKTERKNEKSRRPGRHDRR